MNEIRAIKGTAQKEKVKGHSGYKKKIEKGNKIEGGGKKTGFRGRFKEKGLSASSSLLNGRKGQLEKDPALRFWENR